MIDQIIIRSSISVECSKYRNTIIICLREKRPLILNRSITTEFTCLGE